MPDSPPDTSPPAAWLLKGAALLFAGFGGLTVVWALRTWTTHPETQAIQFGYEAPLWPALAAFVAVGTVAVVALLWTAARRVEAGEDLFAQRHRRRPGGPDDE
jgi:type VI protein secretion system component VasK